MHGKIHSHVLEFDLVMPGWLIGISIWLPRRLTRQGGLHRTSPDGYLRRDPLEITGQSSLRCHGLMDRDKRSTRPSAQHQRERLWARGIVRGSLTVTRGARTMGPPASLIAGSCQGLTMNHNPPPAVVAGRGRRRS